MQRLEDRATGTKRGQQECGCERRDLSMGSDGEGAGLSSKPQLRSQKGTKQINLTPLLCKDGMSKGD